MRYLWMAFLVLFCSSCGGTFWLTPNQHRLFYKSPDGQVSCYSNNCCWPYKEKVMACTSATFDGSEAGSIEIKYVPDK